MDIPEVNINSVNRPAASWQNKVTKHANANAPASSKGLLMKQTTDGTVFSATRQSKIHTLPISCYEFSTTASIPSGDIVRVLPSGSYGVPATVGVFRCVVTTPDPALSTAIYNTYGSGSIYDQWTVKPNAQYYPQYPESSSIATTANPVGRYFEMIGSFNTNTTSSFTPRNWFQGYYNGLLAGTYLPGDGVVLMDSSTNAGFYIRTSATSTGSIPNPVYPMPSTTGGIDFWFFINFGVQSATTCIVGSNKTIELNSTPPF